MKAPQYDQRPGTLSEVRALCEAHHGYGGAGNTCVYAFCVYERDRVVAAYSWQPPAPGAARSVCPEAPGAVLMLSRMVAVPRSDRVLNHVSKPLRRQMRTLIDRERWPVLVTYSDESLGHTGHVYKCSGWTATKRTRYSIFENAEGVRTSSYSNGKHRSREGLTCVGCTYIQRWEHWACGPWDVVQHMQNAGWYREPIPGKFWRSGNQAHTYIKRT